MSYNDLTISEQQSYRRKQRSYIVGFLLALFLTLEAYSLVTKHIVGGMLLLILVGVLALGQFIVHMVFFLHINDESGPRFKLLIFVYMIGVVGILVGGSLYIMTSLNGRMMSPAAMERYINSQDGF